MCKSNQCYKFFVNLNGVKNHWTFKISPFRVTTVLYHLWKIRCWIARTTSTQYLKTNRFATFPMHTNERFFILGKRILEGKLKARSVLLWNFNQVTEYTLFVVIGNTNKFIVYNIKLFLDFCVSLKKYFTNSKLYINYLLILYGLIFILSFLFFSFSKTMFDSCNNAKHFSFIFHAVVVYFLLLNFVCKGIRKTNFGKSAKSKIMKY